MTTTTPALLTVTLSDIWAHSELISDVKLTGNADCGFSRIEIAGDEEAFKVTLSRFEAARATAKGTEKASLTKAIQRIAAELQNAARDAEYARTH